MSTSMELVVFQHTRTENPPMDGFYMADDAEYEKNKLYETREQFAIRSSQIFMELERALDKVKSIEAMLRKEIEQMPTPDDPKSDDPKPKPDEPTNKETTPPTTVWNDTFRPDPESRPPPNKRMKIEQ